MAETRVIWGGQSQSLSHSQQGNLRFLLAPDGLLASGIHPEKQFSYQHWSYFSCLYWCRVVFSLSFTALEWVKKISQWLTAVWRLQNLVIYGCSISVGIPKFIRISVCSQPQNHNTGTEGHEPPDSGGCMDEGSSCSQKMRLPCLGNKIRRESIYSGNLLYRH